MIMAGPLAILALLAAALPADPWSPEQATGAPDTLEAEDAPTAWCPLEPDAGMEWLVVRFEKAVPVAELRIRESLGPGAVVRVSVIRDDGTTKPLWEGQDSTGTAPADFVVRPEVEAVAGSFVIELDTRQPGWSAIDAVELVGTDGSRQWASEAAASSSYATLGALLADELAPEARVFADETAGLRMSAPGWWIRANPALLEAPGTILRAWTRDGKAIIAVLRQETDVAWSPGGLLDRTARGLAEGFGLEIRAREVQEIDKMQAIGLVVTSGEEAEGARTLQHWVAVPRHRDILLFLLSAPAARFAEDERTFRRMLATVEIQASPGTK